MYTIKDGEYLVKLARRAIEVYLTSANVIKAEDAPERLKNKAGVFVTLETYPHRELRGCIGFPEPVYPLVEGTIKAAIAAAVEDPRFPPMQHRAEMDSITVEVSILTPPELIKVSTPQEYPSKVVVGRHGLIVEKGYARGLLLPQVAVEQGWDAEEFLTYTCLKAGLPADCWIDSETRVYRFEGVVFREVEPRGRVVEEKLTDKSCRI